MSHDPSAESRDPLIENSSTSPLPQEEFPEYRLSTVVEPRPDGSRRCIFYPEDAEDEAAAESCWLATNNDMVVSVAQWR